MAKRDFYEVLGVPRDAGDDQVKKAYRKIAFDNHPDRNPGDKAAEQRFKEATEAYEVLRDAAKRQQYDRFGHSSAGGGPGGAGYDVSGFDLADALRAFMRDFGGDGGGGFEDLFGGGGAGGRRVQRGNDLQVRLKLTLEEVATGVEKRIKVKHLRPCGTCSGKGGEGQQTCTKCQGRGQVRRVQQTVFGQFVNVSPCPECQGEGTTFTKRCATCGGDGRVSESDTLAVQVPPGVANGNYSPRRGQGDVGPRGGPSGDLVVLIEEKPHPTYQREGDDLHLEVPVAYPTMTLGGRVEIPLLGGGTAQLEVSAGTRTGHIARMRGKGLPSLRGGHGDLLAHLVVWIPDKPTAAERKLLEELRKLDTARPPKPGRSMFERMKDAFAS